jgi:CRISPR/Cas system-associated exonuclease Cas4 (RecB family)
MLYEMREMIRKEAMPPPTRHRGRCAECEFRRFCGDV